MERQTSSQAKLGIRERVPVARFGVMSEHSSDIGSRRGPELLLPAPRRDARGLAVSLALHAALALLFIGGIVSSADERLGWVYAGFFWIVTAVIGLGPGIFIGWMIWG